MRRFGRVSLFALTGCVVAGMILLGGMTTSLAITNCQQPNSNEKFCYAIPGDAVSGCDDANLCEHHHVYDVKNFPDGAIASSHGLTQQTQADCWRRRGCMLDEMAVPIACISDGGFGNWVPAAKTVSGTRSCPAEE
jgi:hypothetical protein